MSGVTYGKLLDEKLRNVFSDRYGLQLKTPNDWLIKQFEVLINQYPQLKKLDFHRLTLSEICSAIENYCDGSKAVYDEEYDVLIVEPVVKETFFTRKNFLLLFFLCAFGGIPLLKFKASHKHIDSINYRDSEDFDYFISNSKIINDLNNKSYHFITSVYSIFHFIYFLQDKQLDKYGSRPTKKGCYMDTSLAEYIRIKDQQRDINDPFLDVYANNLPQFKNDDYSLTNRNINKPD
jgi:hypothetical protein